MERLNLPKIKPFKTPEKEAIAFAQWLLESDWQMNGDIWAKKAGNYVHGIIEQEKTTIELYGLFKSVG